MVARPLDQVVGDQLDIGVLAAFDQSVEIEDVLVLDGGARAERVLERGLTACDVLCVELAQFAVGEGACGVIGHRILDLVADEQCVDQIHVPLLGACDVAEDLTIPLRGERGVDITRALYGVAMKSILIAAGLFACLATPIAAQQAPPTPEELALFEAAYVGKLVDVERLVAAGTTVDAVDAESRTPMMFAAFNGHRQVVSFLLTQGAKVDSKDLSGRTGLMYASSGPYFETVEVLLDAGAEVNTQGSLEGFTALMTASAEGQIEIVRLLLERGADPTLKDVDGDTALSFAREAGHTAVVELLENPPVRESSRP